MKNYQLTEDMAQDRKYWMTKILAGPAQEDGQERKDSYLLETKRDTFDKINMRLNIVE